ncbi:cytochrome C biogenesis protein [Sulfurovum lithotrophicum]|uniref:Cytochrome C biogenesis protein n=1 Tax=Sulfurovum lithotrophicum TaxID=206403 RepID=A0A7U4RQW1_9BACT|nr:protein-disulfide reductase DsbD [Sulfurovum lithotrophicum]AKF25303.1 cytochrome C biogenesis protein [Sulfurovum lithotrophicum]
MKKNRWMILSVFVLLSATLLYAGVDTETVSGNEGVLSLALGSFVAGLLLTFTPCVLPMVPIVSSIIVGQGKEITKAKALYLSAAYVLGTILTYTVMGALAGATGEQLQAYFQNVWAIGAISLIFVAMALSMFGLYEIQLPSFIQSKLNASSQHIKGGSGPMVFLLGAISALILGACVSPILISFLGIAIAKADPMLGAVTMFFLALGMGIPLLLLGLGAGHLLPKAGEWMNKIKYTFGVLLLATAIYIFNELDLVPPLLPWGILFIVVSIYLGALRPLGEEARGWYKFLKGIGIVVLVWGMLLLIGAAYGQRDILHPLPKLSLNNVSVIDEKNYIPFTLVKDERELDAKIKEAIKARKLLIIYFYKDTCPVCKKLNATTFQDPKVRAKLKEKYVAVKVNITDTSDEKSQAIRKRFNIFGSPSFVFFDRNGKELKNDLFYGYEDPKEFFDTLDIISD